MGPNRQDELVRAQVVAYHHRPVASKSLHLHQIQIYRQMLGEWDMQNENSACVTLWLSEDVLILRADALVPRSDFYEELDAPGNTSASVRLMCNASDALPGALLAGSRVWKR